MQHDAADAPNHPHTAPRTKDEVDDEADGLLLLGRRAGDGDVEFANPLTAEGVTAAMEGGGVESAVAA